LLGSLLIIGAVYAAIRAETPRKARVPAPAPVVKPRPAPLDQAA
jgi:hypothetical protein